MSWAGPAHTELGALVQLHPGMCVFLKSHVNRERPGSQGSRPWPAASPFRGVLGFPLLPPSCWSPPPALKEGIS